MSLNQLINRLPLKQIQHHNPQPRRLRRTSIRHLRIRRRRARIRPIARLPHNIQDGVLEQGDAKLVREDVEADEAIISRVRAIQVLVVERMGVEPLDEVLEVVDAGFGQGACGGGGFAEVVRWV